MSFAKFGCLTVAILVACATAQAEDSTIADFLRDKSLNVVIVVTDLDAATEFYGDILGLQPMSDIQFAANTAPVFFDRAVTMKRFRVGDHEIKLLPGSEQTKKFTGGIDNAIGFRMVNFPIADVEAFFQHLEKNGISKPQIRTFRQQLSIRNDRGSRWQSSRIPLL